MKFKRIILMLTFAIFSVPGLVLAKSPVDKKKTAKTAKKTTKKKGHGHSHTKGHKHDHAQGKTGKHKGHAHGKHKGHAHGKHKGHAHGKHRGHSHSHHGHDHRPRGGQHTPKSSTEMRDFAMKIEDSKHQLRLAKIARIRQIAKETKNAKLLKKTELMFSKETARHSKMTKKIETKATLKRGILVGKPDVKKKPPTNN